MKRVVKCEPTDDICTDKADEGKFYTLETKSNRPFVLVRANATVDGNKDEDQYHWCAIGMEKNRKTGYASFQEAIDGAFRKGANEVKEHATQVDAFTHLIELAKAFETE